MGVIANVALFGALLVFCCSCGTCQRLGTHPSPNTNQVSVISASQGDGHSGEPNYGVSIDDVVLVYMITNRDGAARFVYFMEPTSLIKDLSPRWGNQYRVYPIQDAELVEQDTIETGRPGRPQARIKRLRLKGTDTEGYILQVEVGQIQGETTEAIGSYVDGSSTVSYRYRLKRLGQEWSVADAQLLYIADHAR